MRYFLTLAGLLLASAAPAQPVVRVSLSPAVKRDAQCFILYAIGVGTAKNDSDRNGASIGTMYFYTKLRIGAPDVDLVLALKQESDAIQYDPKIKQIGAECDTELQQRGAELIDLGQKLQEMTPHSSSSS